MAPLTMESAMNLLHNTSEIIQRRNGVKSREAKRIVHAVSLLMSGYPPSDSTGAGRQSTYLDFLQEVRRLNPRNSHSTIIVCVVGLGLSRIAILSSSVRLDLPFEIKKRNGFDNPVLRRLADKYFATTAVGADPQYSSQTEVSPRDDTQTTKTHREGIHQQNSNGHDLQALQQGPSKLISNCH